MAVNILIVGAGAVGAFYGSRLAYARNTQVSVVCRSNYEAVSQHGFSVISPTFESYSFRPHRTFANTRTAVESGLVFDFLVVSTKALPDASDDSDLLVGLVKDGHTAIVLIQNGLGVEEPYAKRFPLAPILSAVTIVSAAQPQHGKIKHNRWTRISIGPFLSEDSLADPQSVDRITREFVDLLKEGGIRDADVYSHSKLQLVRWHKIAINASMNPSSVLSWGTTNQEMARDSELYLHLKGVMDEVLATAEMVLNTKMPPDLATSDAILKSTLKNTSGSKPSMLLDWEQGKRMELEVILGNPIRIARRHGLEMPRMQSLYALLKQAQRNRDKLNRESRL